MGQRIKKFLISDFPKRLFYNNFVTGSFSLG
ncbi:hypothetical protein Bhyg_11226 [Pseudolycoriella hygida]|uniref:Uncharacterized protein n=1 Tax=Pseudolycoriella hygida TaxID=35572 RepID=A0A9Q0RZR0_9DIPT|nr:hypothetical protein Bhyg_11226 [Pseudolycoriella hygida]